MLSFTSRPANDPSRRKDRTKLGFCALHLAPKSTIWHNFLGGVSWWYAGWMTVYLVVGLVALLPSMLLSTLLQWPSYITSRWSLGRNNVNNNNNRNISTTGPTGSLSAIMTLHGRSQMTLCAGGPDHLAPRLAIRQSRLGDNIPGSLMFTQGLLFLERIGYRLTGRFYQEQVGALMHRIVNFSVLSYLHERTCWLDDVVDEFVNRNNDRLVNVVILGAGFDTRCYRLPSLTHGSSNCRLYEVDAVGTQSAKLRVLQEASIRTGKVVFVSCDFERDDWLTRLQDNGMNAGLPTLYIWEGVTMYLTRDAVLETLRKVKRTNGYIALDYFDSTWALTPAMVRLTAFAGEGWKFGLTANEVDQLVAECNDSRRSGTKGKLTILDHLKYQELAKRYLPRYPSTKKFFGHQDDFGGFLLLGPPSL